MSASRPHAKQKRAIESSASNIGFELLVLFDSETFEKPLGLSMVANIAAWIEHAKAIFSIE